MPREPSQARFVSVATEPTDYTDRVSRQNEPVTLRFPCVNVGQMNFDVRNRHRGECVAQRNTRVGIRTGVDDRAVAGPAQSLNFRNKLSLTVRLEEAELHIQLRGDFGEPRLYLRERLGAVNLGFAKAEHVEVRAVDDGDT